MHPQRAGEGPGQDDLPGLESLAVGGDLVGQPVHARGRVAQDAGAAPSGALMNVVSIWRIRSLAGLGELLGQGAGRVDNMGCLSIG